MLARETGLMPCPTEESQSDSPESFSRTRAYVPATPALLAELVAGKAHDGDARAGLLDDVRDRSLAVAHARLLQKAELLIEELVDLALDDLGDGGFGLAFLA